MHYPILLETELAKRWMLSVKTLRAWRQRNVGPRWYILGRHVRYHVADILVFESHALPQWLALEATEHQLKQTSKSGKFVVLDDSPPPANFVDAKTIAAYAKLPYYIFVDPKVRNKRQIPHLQVVGSVRYSPLAVWHWEQEQSVIGQKAPTPSVRERAPGPAATTTLKAPRWYEINPASTAVTKSDPRDALITRHYPALPSASGDFPHTFQHPISKELQ
jgi:hypothetical protein